MPTYNKYYFNFSTSNQEKLTHLQAQISQHIRLPGHIIHMENLSAPNPNHFGELRYCRGIFNGNFELVEALRKKMPEIELLPFNEGVKLEIQEL